MNRYQHRNDDLLFNSLRYHQLCSLMLITLKDKATTGSTPANWTAFADRVCCLNSLDARYYIIKALSNTIYV